MSRNAKQIFQIKVTLDNTHPPVWRRILVPDDTTLLKLHDILQIVMGWQDYHLHMFTIDGVIYGDPADDEYGDLGTQDEAKFTLRKVIFREKQRFSYEYDFGDSWDHTLLVEKILPPQKGIRYPICIKGNRACPPEDVGGVWGYENFLEAIRDPEHEEHDEYLTWVGGEFDPKTFNLAEINNQLGNMGRGRSTEALNAWSRGDVEGTEFHLFPPSTWTQSLPAEHLAVIENNPMRRDVVTLLTYLLDNTVTGTQSTGNFPLKVVYDLCPQFVHPPELDVTRGKYVYRTKSESEVWSLYFRHVLVTVGDLITGGLGRRWKLTLRGEQFLAAPAPDQIWLLMATWWMKANWGIASPIHFEYGYVPTHFTNLALNHLLSLPLNEPEPFQEFADRLIEESRFVYPIDDQDHARRILRGFVERTVIDPMVDFGIFETNYALQNTLGFKLKDLSTFTISPFGKSLLKSIREAIKPERP